MRPLRLTMTAFGPYAGTEVVDFDALTELGLFVVAGNNGAGKTTIFDALHYGLYGTLPGRRSSYVRLKSDHADPSTECRVVLDFVADGRTWRVERSPKQTRPKRRGKGTTEVDRRATLFRLDQGVNGPATAVAGRIGEVDEQCRRLVGLSGRQFERVALLPQGEFSRVLSESSSDRRELLRTLFSSEIFGDATSLLVEQAAEATATDRSRRERISLRLQALAGELQELAEQPVEADVDAIAAAVTALRTELSHHEQQVVELRGAAQAATNAHQRALDLRERLSQRHELRKRLAAHRADTDQHERDLGRLRAARAAVPVVANARSLESHRARVQSAEQRLLDLGRRLNDALSTAGLDPVADFGRGVPDGLAPTVADQAARLGERREAGERLADLERLAASTQADLRRADNDVRTLEERRTEAHAVLRQTQAESDRLADSDDLDTCELRLRTIRATVARRSEFAEIEATHRERARVAADLDARIVELEAACEHARRARLDHDELQRRAQQAVADHQATVERLEATKRFRSASASLTDRRQELARARSAADGLWDDFIAGSAVRIARALVDDEPCPVCGSPVHPDPVGADGSSRVVAETEVRDARARVDTLQAQVQRLESEVEQLHAEYPDIASLELAELEATITTTKAMALGAADVADRSRRSATQLEAKLAELDAARSDRSGIDDELRTLEQQRSRLEGALGDAVHESLESLNAQASAAEQAHAAAHEAGERRAAITQRLHDYRERLEALDIAAVAAESRRQMFDERVTAQQHDVEQARQRVSDLDRTLGFTDFERRARANRQAGELLAETRTAVALLDDALDAVRRAQSILDERVAQSSFPTVDAARAAFLEPEVIEQLDVQTRNHASTLERLEGRLQELEGLPEQAPDLGALERSERVAIAEYDEANRSLVARTTTVDRVAGELATIRLELGEHAEADGETRRLERVAALVKGDNDRNTSLENWVLAAHLRDVVDLANVRLARSTHQRFQLCVLDDGENRRGTWGLDLGVEDTVTGTRRPTAGLSGGELFQASLALALGLADAVMNQTSGVHIDALFIDEGFGSLDETSVERAIDLLDELRDRGAMVGVITHVPALLDALPLGVRVVEAPGGRGSTITQSRRAA